jgi:hypothetical protein
MSLVNSNNVSIYYNKSGFLVPDAAITFHPGLKEVKFLRNNTATGGSVLLKVGGDPLNPADISYNFFFAIAAGETVQILVQDLTRFRLLAAGNDWSGTGRVTTAGLLAAEALQWLGE